MEYEEYIIHIKQNNFFILYVLNHDKETFNIFKQGKTWNVDKQNNCISRDENFANIVNKYKVDDTAPWVYAENDKQFFNILLKREDLNCKTLASIVNNYKKILTSVELSI